MKTNYGYHVIQLQKRIPGTFDASRETVTGQRINAMIKKMMGGEPKFNDDYLNTATLPTPPGAAQPKTADNQPPSEKPAK